MPEQLGPIFVTGTVHDLTYYKDDGKYYVRNKSSLNKERVLSDPAFAKSLRAAAVFGKASKIASEFYRELPRNLKKPHMHAKFTGLVGRLLRMGADEEQVHHALHEYVVKKFYE